MRKKTFERVAKVLIIPWALCMIAFVVVGIIDIIYGVQGSMVPGSIPQPLLWFGLVTLCVSVFIVLVLSVGWLVKKSDEKLDEYRIRLKKGFTVEGCLRLALTLS